MFVWALYACDLLEARNLAFSMLVFGELFRAFAARSTTRVFREVGVFANMRLLAVVVVSVLMQLGIRHLPVAQVVFEIGPISAADCTLSMLGDTCAGDDYRGVKTRQSPVHAVGL